MSIEELKKLKNNKKKKYLLYFKYTDLVESTFYTNDIVGLLEEYDNCINKADTMIAKTNFPDKAYIKIGDGYLIVSGEFKTHEIIIFGVDKELIVERKIFPSSLIYKFFDHSFILSEYFEYPTRNYISL